ncbi:hypothetical protein Ancab_040624 [Ancistrocladus abbreviatus]
MESPYMRGRKSFLYRLPADGEKRLLLTPACTRRRSRLDFARIQIFTTVPDFIKSVLRVKIDGDIFLIRVMEESQTTEVNEISQGSNTYGSDEGQLYRVNVVHAAVNSEAINGSSMPSSPAMEVPSSSAMEAHRQKDEQSKRRSLSTDPTVGSVRVSGFCRGVKGMGVSNNTECINFNL